MSTSNPTIYGTPGSRTQIVEWVALELGVKLDSITLNQTTKNSSEYHAIHPFGKIPGCKAKDGKTGIFESGAIMLYIADVAGSLPTPEARGAAAAWVIWANATCWPKLEESRGKCDLNGLFGPVDAILEKQKWLLSDGEISVADMAVSAYIKYGQLFFGIDITSLPHLSRFMNDVETRPAFMSTVAS